MSVQFGRMGTIDMQQQLQALQAMQQGQQAMQGSGQEAAAANPFQAVQFAGPASGQMAADPSQHAASVPTPHFAGLENANLANPLAADHLAQKLNIIA